MSTDIAISFDTTGSMYPCLAEVRRKVQEFTKTLLTTLPDLRIAVLAHGDYNDVYDVRVLPFTNDVAAIAHFINTAEQTNGFGNGGECYELVMEEASKLEWRADKCALVMLGDEPAHSYGKYVHGGVRGKPDTHIVKLDWREEADQLKENGITIYPVRCLNRSDSQAYHTELAKKSGVPLLHLQQFSNIIPLLTALAYKQHSDERLTEYGTELKATGQLNRNLAAMLNQLLNRTDYAVGGSEYAASSADLAAVDPSRFQLLHVDTDTDIKSFVLSTGAHFRIGHGFYELTKREEIQERKEVVLMNRMGDMFSGAKARELLGLPYGMRGNKYPSDVPTGYTAFVQSTSNNRKLVKGTRFLYEVS